MCVLTDFFRSYLVLLTIQKCYSNVQESSEESMEFIPCLVCTATHWAVDDDVSCEGCDVSFHFACLREDQQATVIADRDVKQVVQHRFYCDDCTNISNLSYHDIAEETLNALDMVSSNQCRVLPGLLQYASASTVHLLDTSLSAITPSASSSETPAPPSLNTATDVGATAAVGEEKAADAAGVDSGTDTASAKTKIESDPIITTRARVNDSVNYNEFYDFIGRRVKYVMLPKKKKKGRARARDADEDEGEMWFEGRLTGMKLKKLQIVEVDAINESVTKNTHDDDDDEDEEMEVQGSSRWIPLRHIQKLLICKEVSWVKFKKFPYWPAVVYHVHIDRDADIYHGEEESDGDEQLAEFYGHSSHAYVARKGIDPFTEIVNTKYCKTKKTSIRKAFVMAVDELKEVPYQCLLQINVSFSSS